MKYDDVYRVGDKVIDDYLSLVWVVDEVSPTDMMLHQNQPNGVKLHVTDETCRMKFKLLTRDPSHNRMYSYVIEDKTPIVGVVVAKSKEEAIKLLCDKYTVVGKGPLMPDSHRIKIEEIKCEGVWQITPDE